MNQVQRVRLLYKTILKMHRGLPPELRILGDSYVKDEFRRHKKCKPAEANTFMREWTNYTVTLAKQIGLRRLKDISNVGESIPNEMLDKLRDDQIQQLYDLMISAQKVGKEPDEQNSK